jgi:hypothetical protein
MDDPREPNLKLLLDVDVEDLTAQALELRAKILQKSIADDIQRGFVNIPYLVDKYSSDTDPTRSQERTLELIKDTFEKIKFRIQSQDLDFELISYLTSNTEFQETLYKMLDENKKYAEGFTDEDGEYHPPTLAAMKVVRDIQRELKNLKIDRIEFLRSTGALPSIKAAGRKTLPESTQENQSDDTLKKLVAEGGGIIDEQARREGNT